MELINYLRIVRRRWAIVALFVLLGAAVGAGSALLNRGPKGPGTTYFLAKHTLSSSDGTANLQRDAAFCAEGEVPRRVAAKLGYDNAQAVGAKITCEPHADTNLLYVAATDTDGRRAESIADTAAEELVGYLRDVGEQQKNTKIQGYQKQIDSLQSEFLRVKDQQATTTDTNQLDLLKARQNDIIRKINDIQDQKNQAESQPAVTETLTTLQTAEAIAISQGAYESVVNSDPAKKDPKASPTANATRQSQIDAAIKSGSGFGASARAGLGAALGLLLGVALVIMLDRIDPRIRTKFEAEDAFGWPVIGEIPPLTRRERQDLALLAYDEPRSRAAEAYRVLRSALLFAASNTDESEAAHPIFANVTRAGTATATGDAEPEPTGDSAPQEVESSPTRGQVIMVTSPGPSEGKTTTAANMAAILAETGRSVIVINCDFRRPRVHLYLGAPDEGRQVVDTKVPGVKLVTQVLDNPHDANPAEVVQVQRQVIRNARDLFDIVLLDTAPLLTTNDATEVLSVADQVVIVAKTGKTHKEAADRAAELLERRSGPVVGVVLVGATDVPTSRYYYYGDNPTDAEPEPGEETSSPFEALLAERPDDVTGADDPGTDGAGTDATGPAAHAEAPAPDGTATPAS